ncbi:Oidioi.mRNA.OKI2018_I69.XSR.g13705.t1.cds [Oikopleura dioica]|uniref:Oidioi.mRNA.OKI2018_I69.XSR.g13705.t1.cds n=1 Tax=Oikopleura dioica TaxID=34765 RepID=A0ABN7S7M4_OIKDI|nr:Oidioi.mRNA.OKI2018_I69.XSR.g13705.t1.cds [Oikopleura dioica]
MDNQMDDQDICGLAAAITLLVLLVLYVFCKLFVCGCEFVAVTPFKIAKWIFKTMAMNPYENYKKNRGGETSEYNPTDLELGYPAETQILDESLDTFNLNDSSNR